LDGITITALISAAAAISGIVLGWLGRSRTVKQDTATEAASDAELRANVSYIARGVDDLRYEIRSQGKRFDELTERVTRVEESAKQAHKRIDRLEAE
jgi:peptidoglycan hydrolase CwlO-like protein